MRLRLLSLVCLLFATTLAAEPPARVVRLNLTDGLVSFRPAGIDEWTDAVVNRPLIDGDELWTDDDSRAEMHIGSAVVRLGASTAFGIQSETDSVSQLRLSAGTLYVRVRNMDEDDIWEIDTPNSSVSLLRSGRYRIDVSQDGLTTNVTARAGEAEVNAGGTAFAVRTGEQAEIDGDVDPTHDIFDAPRPDDFDRWCSNRDVREERIASTHYVPRDLVGYEDLDANGTWRYVSDYGWVWHPTVVVAGWAPYRYGHWAWIEPWGWTWIDDAPWGFAPFHYGRWAYADGGWFWVPGHVVRPVYAPALVVFAGGNGWHVGASIGTVAWWPLAPGEVYVPAYHVSQGYVRNINAPVVNITNINITNINVTNVRYRNQGVTGAITAVPQTAFVSARPVAPVTVAVSAQQALAVKAVGTAAPVAPRPQSVIGVAAAVGSTSARPPRNVIARTVVAKTPPPPPPIPFVAKQNVLTQTPGQPLRPETEMHLRTTTTVRPTTTVVLPPVTTPEKPPRRTFHATTTEQTTTTTTTTTTAPPPPPRTSGHMRAVTGGMTQTTPPTTTTTTPPKTTTTTVPTFTPRNVDRGHTQSTTTSGSTSGKTSTEEKTTTEKKPPRRAVRSAEEPKKEKKDEKKDQR